MARDLAASNPVTRVKFFNEDNSRLRCLTEDEYTRLIQAAKSIETSPFLAEKIILSVHTGLRRGSLFNLRWDYLDFLNSVVRVPRTKSGRPHAVPLNATVVTTLQALYRSGFPSAPMYSRTRPGVRPASREGRQERISHRAGDCRDQGFHLARSPAHVRLMADHERRIASIPGRAVDTRACAW